MKTWHYVLIGLAVVGVGAFVFMRKRQAAAAVAVKTPPSSGVGQAAPAGFLKQLETDALGFGLNEGKKAFSNWLGN